MMYRKTKRSNNGVTWAIFVMSAIIAGSVAFVGYTVAPAEPFAARLVLTGVVLALMIPVLICLRLLLFPFEMEVVIEPPVIRWGRVDRPDRQRSLNIGDVRWVRHYQGNGRLFAKVGRWRLVSIAPRILLSSRERAEFLAALQDCSPGTEIQVVPYWPS